MKAPSLLPLASLALTALLITGCGTGLDRTTSTRGPGADQRTTADSYPTAASYPVYARVGTGANARYRVCHNGRQELVLPAPAVDAHLRHGDTFGRCNRVDRQRHERGRQQGNRNRNRGRGQR